MIFKVFSEFGRGWEGRYRGMRCGGILILDYDDEVLFCVFFVLELCKVMYFLG